MHTVTHRLKCANIHACLNAKRTLHTDAYNERKHFRIEFIIHYSLITEIYIAPLQGYYSEALLTLARLKRIVLRLE